jgi:hypothetical protein
MFFMHRKNYLSITLHGKRQKKRKIATQVDKSAYRRIGRDVLPAFLYAVPIFVEA